MMKRLLSLLLLLCLLPSIAMGEVINYGTPPEGFEGLEVRFLDIGAGDSIYLRCGTESMLVDGGIRNDGTRSFEYFASQGIEGVTYMLNTHCHDDHINGLTQLLKKGFKAETAISIYAENKIAELFIAFIKQVKKKGVAYRQVSNGDSMTLGDASINFYRCEDEDLVGNRNENSLVLHIQYGDRSILLPADIGGNPQRRLAQRNGAALKSDIVKSAHHGLAMCVDEWLSAVDPVFVVCTGSEKRAAKFVKQMEGLGIPMLFAPKGVVHLVTDGNEWYIWQTGHMAKDDQDTIIFPAQ